MYLRIMFVVLVIAQVYDVYAATTVAAGTSVAASTVKATTAKPAAVSTTGGASKTTPVAAGPVTTKGASLSAAVSTSTPAPKLLTCRTGSCNGKVSVCALTNATSSTATCTVGQVCSVQKGNGNSTYNTYQYKCSDEKACKNNIQCCKKDNCMALQQDNGCTNVHIGLTTVVITLLAMLVFV